LEDLLFFDHNEKSSVLLIFFAHAIVFSFLLLRRGIEEGTKDSKWLAAFLFLGGLYICPFMLGYAGWYASARDYWQFMFFMPFQQLFLIGPVFFFYIKSLLHRDFKLTSKDFIHFLPAALYLIYSLIVFIGDKLIFDEFYFYADGKDKDLSFWYQMAGLISMLSYLMLSLRAYNRYRKISLQEVSFADEIAFTWIRNFALAFGLILILRVLFFVLNPAWGQFGRKFWYYLCFSILLVYISTAGYSISIRASVQVRLRKLSKLQAIQEGEVKAPVHSSNEIEAQQVWKEKLTKLFEKDSIYENPNLTLSDVASLLDTNRNVVSKVINQTFEMNFNDFVNERRAEAVIHKLKQGEHGQNTLLAIALDCGFNSKTTFNRAFKKHTGTTPRQFILKNQL